MPCIRDLRDHVRSHHGAVRHCRPRIGLAQVSGIREWIDLAQVSDIQEWIDLAQVRGVRMGLDLHKFVRFWDGLDIMQHFVLWKQVSAASFLHFLAVYAVIWLVDPPLTQRPPPFPFLLHPSPPSYGA